MTPPTAHIPRRQRASTRRALRRPDSVARRTREPKARDAKVGGSRRPVSRVLSVHMRANAFVNRTVIPLGVQSPKRSSSLPAARCRETPWSRRAVSRRLFGLAPAGVYHAVIVTDDAVGSYPTISPLPRPVVSNRISAVCFLLHCPSHEARAACAQALPGNLPCGARTFLGTPSHSPMHRDRPVDDFPSGNIPSTSAEGPVSSARPMSKTRREMTRR